jgi:DNA repair exonuclease SbcCD ATPase subunit
MKNNLYWTGLVLVAFIALIALADAPARAGTATDVKQSISDLRETIQEFQKSVNDTKRYTSQSKRDVNNIFKQLQRGNVNVSRLEQLLKNADKALVNLDNARSEFSNLEDLRRQLQPIGDLAVKIVELGNRGLITNSVVTAVLRDLSNLAKQIDSIQKDMVEVGRRLQISYDLVSTGLEALETALDNVDFGVTTTPSSILVDPSDLEPAREAFRDADKNLFTTDIRLQRLLTRAREINTRLSSIDSRVRPKDDEEEGGENTNGNTSPRMLQADSVPGQITYFTLTGQFLKEVPNHGVYLVVTRLVTQEGIKRSVKKVIAGK